MYEESFGKAGRHCLTASCKSSCKCQVEILSPSDSADDSGFGGDFHRRSTIRIRDCDCSMDEGETNNNSTDCSLNNNTNRNAKEHFPLMVDNPGYMMDSPMFNGKQPTKMAVSLPPLFEVKQEHIAIGSQDLISFAKQISNGMVST